MKTLEPHLSQYKYLVYRAGIADIECTLTYDDYLQMAGKPCAYCGDSIDWEAYKSKEKNYSKAYYVDRKDNNLGYTQDNCVPCCPTCNRCKCKMSHTEFIKMCLKIVNGPLADTLNENDWRF